MTSAPMSVHYPIPPFMFKVEYIIKMDANIEPNLVAQTSQELPRARGNVRSRQLPSIATN
jgi:hypothetical protein